MLCYSRSKEQNPLLRFFRAFACLLFLSPCLYLWDIHFGISKQEPCQSVTLQDSHRNLKAKHLNYESSSREVINHFQITKWRLVGNLLALYLWEATCTSQNPPVLCSCGWAMLFKQMRCFWCLEKQHMVMLTRYRDGRRLRPFSSWKLMFCYF